MSLKINERFMMEVFMKNTIVLLYIVPILFLFISLYLYNKFKDDKDSNKTLRFYPPKKLNSLEVGFIYKGNATDKDVTSLLLYLANKGYIKIVKTKDSYELVKIKEYDGDNINEELFIDRLFTKKRKPNFPLDENKSGVITSSDLYNNFYITMSKILSNINNDKDKIYEKGTLLAKLFVTIMVIITYCIITIFPVLEYKNDMILFMALVFPIIFLCIYINVPISNNLLANICFTLGLFVVPWCGLVLPILFIKPLYLLTNIYGLACIVGMIICAKHISKRTKYGKDMLEQIEGLKQFIRLGERNKILNLLEENSNYFYDILPYAYTLNDYDAWIEKFKDINLVAPDWYEETDNFNLVEFSNFIKSTMKFANHSMTSSDT